MTTLPIPIDVAIIGAGPAGLSTALHLVQLDPDWSDRLIVLEKERHPRHKPCGGGITCFGLNRLQSLGLPLGVPFVPVTTARLLYRDRCLDIHGDPVFVVTWRSEFDAWLAACAQAWGVNLIQNSEVTHLDRNKSGVKIYTEDATYFAKVIVGADGSRGFVRKWLGARERPAHVSRVLEAITPAYGMERAFGNREAHFVFDDLRSDLQGYFWVFPSWRNGQPILNTGVYDARVNGEGPKAELKRIMAEGLREVEIDLHGIKIEGHPIHWFSPWNRFSDDRVILVGDAAGTDPLFGEGISVSLAYGDVASMTLARAFRDHDFCFKDYKWSILYSPVGRYLLLRWFIASMVSRIQRSDFLVRGIWSVGKLLAHFFHPSSELPEVCPFQMTPAKRMSEIVKD